MKKLIVLAVVLVGGLILGASMKSAYFVTIVSENGYEICSGYGPEHAAYMQVVSGPPISLPVTARMEYLWKAEHANATKIWHTAYPYREVPLPWPGEYEVSVRVLYFNGHKKRPFAVFGSNTVHITGLHCEGLGKPSPEDMEKYSW